jgi:hypothetical protein
MPLRWKNLKMRICGNAEPTPSSLIEKEDEEEDSRRVRKGREGKELLQKGAKRRKR